MARVACFPREEDVKGELDSCHHLAYRQNHHPYPMSCQTQDIIRTNRYKLSAFRSPGLRAK